MPAFIERAKRKKNWIQHLTDILCNFSQKASSTLLWNLMHGYIFVIHHMCPCTVVTVISYHMTDNTSESSR